MIGHRKKWKKTGTVCLLRKKAIHRKWTSCAYKKGGQTCQDRCEVYFAWTDCAHKWIIIHLNPLCPTTLGPGCIRNTKRLDDESSMKHPFPGFNWLLLLKNSHNTAILILEFTWIHNQYCRCIIVPWPALLLHNPLYKLYANWLLVANRPNTSLTLL